MRSAWGAGLIEVLVGLLVISFGVVGMARFHAVVMRESGHARAHSVAVQLARAKLDDLRAFAQLDGGGRGVFAYDEIADDAGGAEDPAGALQLPAGELGVGSLRYQRSWTATDHYYCAPAIAASPQACLPPRQRADYKALTVTIAWTDADGEARSVRLSDTASAVDPVTAALALIPAAVAVSPLVTHVPDTAPEAIGIDLGGAQHLETSVPRVTLNTEGERLINTIVRYEIVRVDEQGQTLVREAFTTVDCHCRQSGEGAGIDLQGGSVSKRIGAIADEAQAFECGVCCRDHHDDSRCEPAREAGRQLCYDPERPSTEYDGGSHDHHHYGIDGSRADGVGDRYVESCRLQRINGELRVAQDWRLIRLDLIPQHWLAPEGVPDAARAAAYGDYVKRVVAATIRGDGLPEAPWPARATLARSAQARLLARGIYLAPLDAASRAAWAARLRSGDAAVFQQLPFYVLDVSRFARWSSSLTAVAQLADAAPAGEGGGTPGSVRGLASGTTTISASLPIGNRGFAGEPGVADGPMLSASLQIVVE